MADRRRTVDAYAEALFDGRQRRGRRWRRSRTSCSASPGSSRPTTSCATTLTDPHLPVSRRQQIVEDLLGGKARPATTNTSCSASPGSSRATTSCAPRSPTRSLPVEPAPADRRGPPRRQGQPGHHGAGVDGGRHRPGPRPARRSSTSSSSSAPPRPTRRWPRSARPSSSPTTRSSAWPRPSSQATGKKVEVKVIVDPTVLGGLVAQVGDTVIDGSVRRRLEQLQHRVLSTHRPRRNRRRWQS